MLQDGRGILQYHGLSLRDGSLIALFLLFGVHAQALLHTASEYVHETKR